MRKTILGALVLPAALALLPGCGGSSNCIILANGGRKLCGDEAKAWCDSTDSLREKTGDPTIDASLDDSIQACKDVRGE